jgi:hypothetical protein
MRTDNTWAEKKGTTEQTMVHNTLHIHKVFMYLPSYSITSILEYNVPLYHQGSFIFLYNVSPYHSGTTVIRYDESQKIEKPKSLQAFGNMKSKGSKQDSQNCVRSHIPEGAIFLLYNNQLFK